MDKTEYTIQVSGNAPWLFPTDTLFGLLWYTENEAIEIPKALPFYGEWGNVISEVLSLREEYPMPTRLNLLWLALTEHSFYEIETDLPVEKMVQRWNYYNQNENTLFSHIVVGMAPYGKVAIWFHGINKAEIIDCFQGVPIEIEMKDFLPFYSGQTLQQYCNQLIEQVPSVKQNLATNGLPPRDLFDNYMKQFTYRYVVRFGHWDDEKKEWKEYEDETNPEFDYIEEALFDGTHDKLHDGGLMKYHEAGKPKKLALQWHVKKSDYSTYLWFDGMAIRAAFEQFYYKYPEAKMDFTFHIDTAKKVFQLSLGCDEAEEPMSLSEDTYQMIVFKSKFEYYRTANYNQPRGAWIW